MPPKDTKVFSPANRQEWRKWLEENHSDERAVWLVYHKPKILTWTKKS
ncbi:hypothetical protein [Dyadobacter fermentans]|nr:hypothetical protein [Dyadobacter fermentans]MBZ1361253.1 hypothetical protein [Dyadobacter fermentans]